MVMDLKTSVSWTIGRPNSETGKGKGGEGKGRELSGAHPQTMLLRH